MKKLKKPKLYYQVFSAWQVQKGEKVSVMRGKKRDRVAVGDWVVTDQAGNSFGVAGDYFRRECRRYRGPVS